MDFRTVEFVHCAPCAQINHVINSCTGGIIVVVKSHGSTIHQFGGGFSFSKSGPSSFMRVFQIVDDIYSVVLGRDTTFEWVLITFCWFELCHRRECRNGGCPVRALC